MTNCEIWGTPAKVEPRVHGAGPVYNSPRAGGRYEVGRTERPLQDLPETQKLLLTTWIVDQNRLGSTPLIDILSVDRIQELRPLVVRQRLERMLRYLAHRESWVGEGIKIAGRVNAELVKNQHELLAWTESAKDKEVWYLMNECAELGWIRKRSNDSQVFITAKGHEFHHNLDNINPFSTQAFVAMWFDHQLDETYEHGFARGIREAGYTPSRIDRIEHINKIDDEIIAEIRRSRFLVADFTSEPEKPRGGVYFEAGFAYGLRIPVIWTCREDSITHVHFDTRQFNHIVWVSSTDLCEKLKNRIGAVIGDGPLKGRA